jgi:hypothetical protein
MFTCSTYSNFLIRRDFSSNPARLRKRLMAVGLCMLMLSPFLTIFMLMYFFLRNAEQFYHQPSAAGSRRWSNLAKWTFREFNEVRYVLIEGVFFLVIFPLVQPPPPTVDEELVQEYIAFLEYHTCSRYGTGVGQSSHFHSFTSICHSSQGFAIAMRFFSRQSCPRPRATLWRRGEKMHYRERKQPQTSDEHQRVRLGADGAIHDGRSSSGWSGCLAPETGSYWPVKKLTGAPLSLS